MFEPTSPTAGDGGGADVVVEEDDFVVVADYRPESERVFEWRKECFSNLGFAEDDAASMADDLTVDLSLVRRLIATGCPVALARRIA